MFAQRGFGGFPDFQALAGRGSGSGDAQRPSARGFERANAATVRMARRRSRAVRPNRRLRASGPVPRLPQTLEKNTAVPRTLTDGKGDRGVRRMRAGEVATRWTPTVSRRERAQRWSASAARVARANRIPSRRAGTGPSGPSGDGQLGSSDEVARGRAGRRSDAMRRDSVAARDPHVCRGLAGRNMGRCTGAGDVPSTVAGV